MEFTKPLRLLGNMENLRNNLSHYTVRLITTEDLEDYFSLIQNNRQRLEDFFAGTVAITKTLEETKTHLETVIMLNQKKFMAVFIMFLLILVVCFCLFYQTNDKKRPGYGV